VRRRVDSTDKATAREIDGKIAVIAGAGTTERRNARMPHVIVKLHAGRSETQKARLAEEVTKAVMAGAGCGADAVSVSIEDIAPKDWVEKVYKPDIAAHPHRLYKKPGYDPL
jgi:4-oxalocrotonate tautomerase